MFAVAKVRVRKHMCKERHEFKLTGAEYRFDHVYFLVQ